MKHFASVTALVVGLLGAQSLSADSPDGRPLVRGDANWSFEIDISDAVTVLNFLFLGGAPPRCPGLADANASGEIDISDAVTILSYLFSGGVALSDLDEEEREFCEDPFEVLRSGRFTTLQHEVSGVAEHLSNGKIRLRKFSYDGGGLPDVHVWLHRNRTTERQGRAISVDLRRETPYLDVTMSFEIPEDITGDDFGYVSIWCTSFPANYGYARMLRPNPN